MTHTTKNQKKTGTGDLVWQRSLEGAEEINSTNFAKSLREGTMSKEQFLQFVSNMYPIVTGFCGALCRMIPNFDHVESYG